MGNVHRLAAVLTACHGSNDLRHYGARHLKALRGLDELSVHNRAVVQHISDVHQAAVKDRLKKVIRIMEVNGSLFMGL